MLHGGTPSLGKNLFLVISPSASTDCFELLSDMGSFGVKGQRKNKLAKGMETAEMVGRRRGRAAIAI